MKYSVNPYIQNAQTLPGTFYADQAAYTQLLETVFAASWQFIGHATQYPFGYHIPITLLPGSLDEPLILDTQENTSVSVYSNVCTHRGYVLLDEPRPAGKLRCRYHGRCFNSNGMFLSMPEFEQAEDFPSGQDHLKAAGAHQWNGFYLTAVQPRIAASHVLNFLDERLYFFPFDRLQHREEAGETFLVKAHWALYCDNYLEGFHIPFVHGGLNKVIDYDTYETLLFDGGSLQIGMGKKGDYCFDLPIGHPDHGKQIAAYYYWLFPNTMVNVYPWGISLNIIEPLGLNETRVRFETYVAEPSLYNLGAGSGLHQVEMEDEEVVEKVHLGLRSRLYTSGRFSPTRETGVHHFHRMLAQAL